MTVGHDTGKVVIGLTYTPPPRRMDETEQATQILLLPKGQRLRQRAIRSDRRRLLRGLLVVAPIAAFVAFAFWRWA